jgi:hypothetical protein
MVKISNLMVEHLIELVVAFAVELENIVMELEQRLSMRNGEKGDIQILALIVSENILKTLLNSIIFSYYKFS